MVISGETEQTIAKRKRALAKSEQKDGDGLNDGKTTTITTGQFFIRLLKVPRFIALYLALIESVVPMFSLKKLLIKCLQFFTGLTVARRKVRQLSVILSRGYFEERDSSDTEIIF